MLALFELLILWLFLAVAIGQVLLARRALALETREGLAPSRLRVSASIITALVIAMLIAAVVSSRIWPAIEDRPALASAEIKLDPSDPRTKRLLGLREERELLLIKLSDLDGRIDALEVELGRAPEKSPAPRTPGLWSRTWRGLADSAVLLVPLVVLAGFVAFLMLGDRSILLHPELLQAKGDDEKAQKARDELDSLAAATDEGRYREALELADAIDPDSLDPFNWLDWAYLRAYCVVQITFAPGDGPRPSEANLAASARQLELLLEQAPARGEAAFVLGLVQHLRNEPQAALDAFARARSMPSAKALPISVNESVCLLQLAEVKLGEGDAEAAGRLFDRVTALGALVDRIPSTLVKIRLLNVRKSLQADRIDEATQGLEAVRQVQGLDAEQSRNVQAVCDAIGTLIATREGTDAQAADRIRDFLARHLPGDLPPLDDSIADEHLDAPIAAKDLPFAPQIYRVFLFLEAGARARMAAKDDKPLTPEQARAIARPLLRALQFELRQRDVLAALGGLYYWFVPDQREHARRWLESAIDLGVDSRVARRIVERERRTAQETREALDWFRSASSRFLQDPTLSAEVRRALIDEMSRFQEFQPLLLEYSQATDPEPREPTLSVLRDRAAYLDGLVADLASRDHGAANSRLGELRSRYVGLIEGLDASARSLSELEKQLVQEVGRAVRH